MLHKYHEPHLLPHKKIRDPLPDNWKGYDKRRIPWNFKAVDGKVFRSSLVLPHHVPVLQEVYGIKHIVSLLHGDYLSEYYDDSSITIHQFPHLGSYVAPENISKIMKVLDKSDGNVVVQCLKGQGRTGKVIAAHRIVNHGKSRFSALVENILGGNVNLGPAWEILTEDFQ